GAITSKTRQEAMAGLEAEHQGLLTQGIERGPKGIEFYDGQGHPFDVKAPRSPPEGARWDFNAQQSADSILHELRKDPVANGRTGEPEPINVILDSTYLGEAHHRALWEALERGARPGELERIFEVNVELGARTVVPRIPSTGTGGSGPSASS